MPVRLYFHFMCFCSGKSLDYMESAVVLDTAVDTHFTMLLLPDVKNGKECKGKL